MISFKGAHFPQDIMLMGVRWYVGKYAVTGLTGRPIAGYRFRTVIAVTSLRSSPPLSVLVYCSLWYWTIGHGIMAYSVLMPYGRW